MLVHPSSIDLSSRTLRYLTGQLAGRRREIGTRWRRLAAGRQALLALAHLRCGDTYAQLAAARSSESRRTALPPHIRTGSRCLRVHQLRQVEGLHRVGWHPEHRPA